mmetsp:Transcript_43006/g.71476  ORF Transcript_43006/g.71476 Transcript_43006/m.71476 type:complete len:419 (+) Transcript_43006:79-1335(+)
MLAFTAALALGHAPALPPLVQLGRPIPVLPTCAVNEISDISTSHALGTGHWDSLEPDHDQAIRASRSQGSSSVSMRTGQTTTISSSASGGNTNSEVTVLVGTLLIVCCALSSAPAAAASVNDVSTTTAAVAATVLTPSEILSKASRKALGGGVSGALAGVFQVLMLMWLRTTMNYQYRNGGSTKEALAALYVEGGVSRFYRGVGFALVQTPLARFGDTAANSGVLAFLAASDSTLPIGLRTALASGAASLWRIGLTPIDTLKTTMQVKGSSGVEQVKQKVSAEGPSVLYQGALANAAASFIGNYPWYLTFNALNEALPLAPDDDLKLKLIRSACLGISAAAVSDCISNSIRVLKVTRQTSERTIGYKEAARQVIETDGWQGLLGRGLGTRLCTNALQAALFTVAWKLLEDLINRSDIF